MPPKRPNILLFFTDQHRLSALGCYGPTPCLTPNIDRLAAEGVRFETAYTCCPVCTPARASIMTGLHVHNHGMLCNVEDLPCPVRELPDGPHLLSRRLAQAGYRCGHDGKWHLGARNPDRFGLHVPSAHPTERGFEWPKFPGYEQYLSARGLDPMRVRADAPQQCVRLDGPPEASVPYWLAEQTISMIDDFAGDERPWFIWHCEPGPHAAYEAPAEYLKLYKDADIPPWPDYGWDAVGTNRPHQVKIHARQRNYGWQDWAEVLRYYYARTTDIDAQLGRIVAHLKQRGLAEETVVIFTSDHGQTLGSHGGLVDKGWHHFEETHRIGMVVKHPGGWGASGRRPGEMVQEWASLLDLHPTILDLAGAEFDCSAVHGRSLVPVLEGRPVEWRDEVFVEFWGVNGLATTMATCRSGDLKYGWNCGNWDELYDLARDPHELNNVVADPAYAERLTAMRERMASWMEETAHPGAPQVRARRLLGL